MKFVSYCREIAAPRADEFLSKGYRGRHFFPHRVYYIPKCGPDGYKLAQRMFGETNPNNHWEIILYAASAVADEFPVDLFYDDDLVWHQQQFGLPGQVATANMVIQDQNLYSMVHVSDLVQRISRRREYKSRIENRFKGWPYMLLNSIMNFAIENGVRTVHTPPADFALRHTDPNRDVRRALSDRVYDTAPNAVFRPARRGQWWVIDVAANRNRVVAPETRRETVEYEKTICLCHDIERGFGHLDVDPDFAKHASRASPRNLQEMLRHEQEAGVIGTYSVVGNILNDVRHPIEDAGHCVAFHSYDHAVGGDVLQPTYADPNIATIAPDHGAVDQLARCRRVDYRIKGYRPPRSRITPELSEENLCWHNFEWLASSALSLGRVSPDMERRIVKIPIAFDDFDLHRRAVGYSDWEKTALDMIARNDFLAFSLHDCYADHWLPHYRRFLEKATRLGEFRTLDEVASSVLLGNTS